MRRVRSIDNVIKTCMPFGRMVALSKSRRRRTRKKYLSALVLRPDDLINVADTIAGIRMWKLEGLVPTERCEKRVARYLRRSGQRIVTIPHARVADLLRRWEWPPAR